MDVEEEEEDEEEPNPSPDELGFLEGTGSSVGSFSVWEFWYLTVNWGFLVEGRRKVLYGRW